MSSSTTKENVQAQPTNIKGDGSSPMKCDKNPTFM
jgi:hypothetical protein